MSAAAWRCHCGFGIAYSDESFVTLPPMCPTHGSMPRTSPESFRAKDPKPNLRLVEPPEDEAA